MYEKRPISTAGEYHRVKVKAWLELPGIDDHPIFREICREIAKNDDEWLHKNSARIREIENSGEVRLFLIKRGAMGPLSLASLIDNCEDEEIKKAAIEALGEWLQGSERGFFLSATHMRAIQQFSEQIRCFVSDTAHAAAVARREMDEFAQTMSQCMKATSDVLQRSEYLASIGWTLPLDMPMPEFRNFHRELAQTDLTIKQVEEWFLQYYKTGGFARLKHALISSRQLLFWKPLLQQCIVAFGRGDYRICIPSLLLVLEGSLAKPWSVAFHKERARNKFFKQKIRDAIPKSVQHYMWMSVSTFVREVFETGVLDEQTYLVPKRNLILHGKSDPSNWDEGDCLRLFQAISTVALLHEQLVKVQDGQRAAGRKK